MKQSPTPLCRRLVAVAVLCFSMIAPFPAFGTESLEELLNLTEPEGNIEDLLDVLQDLRKRKLPVNEASTDRLLRLPFLSPIDAEKIVKWRALHGPIGSVSQLEKIIGTEKAGLSAPYLSFSAGLAAGEAGGGISGNLCSRVYWESPPRKGIENGKYEGDNRKLYSRVQAGSRHIGFSLVQESDIGEPDTTDLLSFTVHAEDIGIVREAVAGNYNLSFGQGLLFGQGRYFSKGSEPVAGVQGATGAVKPYSSASEEGFMQGAAVTLAPGPFEITAFASRNRVDATIDSGVVSSLSTNGYHRTTYEQQKKDNLVQKAEGVNLRYRYRSDGVSAMVGGTLAGWSHSLPLAWLDSGVADRMAESFEGTLLVGQTQLFGEAALSQAPDALSWIMGVQSNLSPDVTGIAVVRQYDRKYYSPFAGAFAERGGDGANEEGFYLGLNAKLLRNLQLGASYDMFRFPELSDTFALPSTGHDGRLYLTWRQSPAVTWQGMYQHKQKEEARTEAGFGGLTYVMPVQMTTNHVRLGLETRISPIFTLKTRGEYKSVESELFTGKVHEKGWLAYEQVNCRLGKLSVKTRLTAFNTDSYDSAIYSYEDDLPLVYTLSPFYGRGRAMFVVLSYDPLRNFHLAAKYETTWYADRKVYSSGNDLRATSSPGSYHIGCTLQF
jgi:hypothetical protein